VGLAVHPTLATTIRTILATIAVLSVLRHVLILIAAGIIVHGAASSVLVYVGSIVGVGVVLLVWVTVAVSSSTLAGDVLGGGGLLCRSRKGGIGGRMTAVRGVHVAVAARRLRGGNLWLLRFGTRDTETGSSALRKRGILELVVVGVRKALVASVER
jgi:hypothetical protein